MREGRKRVGEGGDGEREGNSTWYPCSWFVEFYVECYHLLTCES